MGCLLAFFPLCFAVGAPGPLDMARDEHAATQASTAESMFNDVANDAGDLPKVFLFSARVKTLRSMSGMSW